MAKIKMTQEGSTPATPSSGDWWLYPTSTGLKVMDSTGAVFEVSYNRRAFTAEVFGATSALATGDGKRYIPIPAALAGMNLVDVDMELFAKSTSGIVTVQIARGRQASAGVAHTFSDMLSTKLTVDVNEFDSQHATTPPVINPSFDDLAEGDLLRVDVDIAGTGATGMWIRFEARLP